MEKLTEEDRKIIENAITLLKKTDVEFICNAIKMSTDILQNEKELDKFHSLNLSEESYKFFSDSEESYFDDFTNQRNTLLKNRFPSLKNEIHKYVEFQFHPFDEIYIAKKLNTTPEKINLSSFRINLLKKYLENGLK